MNSARKYNLVIFGASGFTGQFVVEELVKSLIGREDAKANTVKWAVAGRSVSKLTQILIQASDATGTDLSSIDKIVAEISSQASLVEMAKQTSILINCVGPYIFFGAQVVEACLEAETHYLDICGEMQFVEKVQLLHHSKAEEKGIYIISSCGSIPPDMGVLFLQQKFDGDLNAVESFMERKIESASRSVIHFATWQAMIYTVGHSGELKPIRRKLYPTKLPSPEHVIKKRSTIHKNAIVNTWCTAFPGPDGPVVNRSQRHFHDMEQQRPIQIETYMQQPNLVVSIATIFIGAMLTILAPFRCGRYLLERFPAFFSFGTVSHEGPTREVADSIKFTYTLSGEGWNKKLDDKNQNRNRKDKPDKRMVVKVQGKNPAYGGTCICLVQAALTLLEETGKLPSRGGVYTPGSAFAKTTLIERLNKHGVTFKVATD